MEFKIYDLLSGFLSHSMEMADKSAFMSKRVHKSLSGPGDWKNFMKDRLAETRESILRISSSSWKAELDKKSYRYHITAVWVAIIFNPLFAFTDFINIPRDWKFLLVVRLLSSSITFLTLSFQRKLQLPLYSIVLVPFVLISLQNAYTYSLIGNGDLLGQNLNYIALLLGAALFVLWPWRYSVGMVWVSGFATMYFLWTNPRIEMSQFFLEGGLLLAAMAVFMIILIQARYNLNIKEIKARLALHESNEQIRAQAEEIKGINENLETLVKDRTRDLEKKNKALEEYAFINAHKLRSPLASILGLINLLNTTELNDDAKEIKAHLEASSQKLDEIVSAITDVIEKAERE
jgi:signal transduction histidine kinase